MNKKHILLSDVDTTDREERKVVFSKEKTTPSSILVSLLLFPFLFFFWCLLFFCEKKSKHQKKDCVIVSYKCFSPKKKNEFLPLVSSSKKNRSKTHSFFSRCF